MILKNCPPEDFAAFLRTENKNIVCYGAGQIMQQAVDYLDAEVIRKIIAVADKAKCGGRFSYKTLNVPIISPDELCMYLDGTMVLMITLLDYITVFHQFDKLLNNNCFIYPLIRELANDHVPPTHNPHAAQRIPKRIHCVWFGKAQMSELNVMCMASWKKYCPDYEITIWNEDNFDVNKHPFSRSAHSSGKWAQAADYARFSVLKEYGGVYLDTDIELLSTPDEMLYNEFFGFRQSNWFGFFAFGSTAQNPILAEMMKPFDEENFSDISQEKFAERFYVKHYNILNMKERFGAHIWQDGEGIDGGNNIYPQDMITLNSRLAQKNQNTIGIHHYERTWSDATNTLKEKEKGFVDFINKHAQELGYNAK